MIAGECFFVDVLFQQQQSSSMSTRLVDGGGIAFLESLEG